VLQKPSKLIQTTQDFYKIGLLTLDHHHLSKGAEVNQVYQAKSGFIVSYVLTYNKFSLNDKIHKLMTLHIAHKTTHQQIPCIFPVVSASWNITLYRGNSNLPFSPERNHNHNKNLRQKYPPTTADMANNMKNVLTHIILKQYVTSPLESLQKKVSSSSTKTIRKITAALFKASRQEYLRIYHQSPSISFSCGTNP